MSGNLEVLNQWKESSQTVVRWTGRGTCFNWWTKGIEWPDICVKQDNERFLSKLLKTVNFWTNLIVAFDDYVILCAFPKLRKAIITVTSIRPSVHMEQRGSHWTGFHGNWYLSIYRKSVKKSQFSLKADKNNGYLTWRPIYIYDISLSYS